MSSEPLIKCPSGKKGRHNICAILPGEDGKPVLLFCSLCGVTIHQAMDLPVPLDDLPADAIARMAKG